jgi:hypothetical protein
MSDAPNQRMVRLLIPDASRTRVVIDRDGGLPGVPIEVPAGTTTMLAVRRAVLPAIGLAGHVTDCFIDDSPIEEGRPVPTLVELPTPDPAWRLPSGWRWNDLAATPDVEVGLVEHLADRLDEWRARRAPNVLRTAWSHPDWYEQACSWIDDGLRASGRPSATLVEQCRHWGISAVMRVEHPAGIAWFKAAFPPFRQEAPITEYLDARAPGSVAPVIAASSEHGWLLLDDVGDETFEARPADNASAVERLVALQRRFVGRGDELVAVGAPERRFSGLADDLRETLAEPTVRAQMTVEPARAEQLLAWVEGTAAEVSGLEIPDTLVHGDFHPGNVALVDGTAVIFDWTDAAISNPFLDVVTWAWWLRDDPDAAAALWPTFAAAWDGTIDADAVLDARSAIEGLAYAYHTVSYGRILRALEPSRQGELAGGITEFLGGLDRVVPA